MSNRKFIAARRSPGEWRTENGGDGWESNPTSSLKDRANLMPDSAEHGAFKQTSDLGVQSSTSPSLPSTGLTELRRDVSTKAIAKPPTKPG
jgi:hypothetical protein